jgi:mono/diheme cytochrome c family protein
MRRWSFALIASGCSAIFLFGSSVLGGSDLQPSARSLYSEHCARCHGASGKGDGAEVTTLRVRPHSFDDCAWMAMMSNATLFLAIKDGASAIRPDSEMPGYGRILSDSEMAVLVDYVRHFCEGQSQSSPGLVARSSGSQDHRH